jgi:S-methyl-5-thioribose-1-phosphate isomerase
MVCSSWLPALQMRLLEASLHKIGQPQSSCGTTSIYTILATHYSNQVKINGKNYKSVWMENGIIKAINQLLLPDAFKIMSLVNHGEVATAISTMAIRGALAIGAAGAYGLAQACLALNEPNLREIRLIKEKLAATRPTAYDLFHGLDFVFSAIQHETDLAIIKQKALEASEEYARISIDSCKRIGELGNALLGNGARILTHCNAGAIATIDYGTALAPMRIAHAEGKNIFVFVDETRPRLQGARLTAWELCEEGIPCALIADNAAGFYMQRGEIDIVITGADRIARNGDTANKIGTYEKAVLAKENGVPFYIAAPVSTFDAACASGEDIPIEERDEKEVIEIQGVRLAPARTHARNPAFDVTPARYITGIITEKGIIRPDSDEISRYLGKR